MEDISTNCLISIEWSVALFAMWCQNLLGVISNILLNANGFCKEKKKEVIAKYFKIHHVEGDIRKFHVCVSAHKNVHHIPVDNING